MLGSLLTADDAQLLNNALGQFADSDAADETRAPLPLSAASVDLNAVRTCVDLAVR